MHSVKDDSLLDQCVLSQIVIPGNILPPPPKGRFFLFNPQPNGNFTSVTYFAKHLKPPTNWEFLI